MEPVTGVYPMDKPTLFEVIELLTMLGHVNLSTANTLVHDTKNKLQKKLLHMLEKELNRIHPD